MGEVQVQKVGQYKNAYITYSLGNFIFDQNFSPETMQGGLLEVEVNLNTKLIEKVNLKKVLLNNKFQIESIILPNRPWGVSASDQLFAHHHDPH